MLRHLAKALSPEAFGRFPLWTQEMIDGLPSLPGSRHAFATIEVDERARICDLNDAARLVTLGLRPSEVVEREYARTQAVALQLFLSGGYDGLMWWSYYEPSWNSVGLWN